MEERKRRRRRYCTLIYRHLPEFTLLYRNFLCHTLHALCFFDSVAGNNFDFGHITRAVCCRVLDVVRDCLPAGYDLRHPIVGRVSVYEPTPVQSSKIAINWCEADSDVEIISTVTGRTIQELVFLYNEKLVQMPSMVAVSRATL